MTRVVYEKRDRIGYITPNRPEPWQCDHVGHMNAMWYVGKFDEATRRNLQEIRIR